MPKPAPHPSSPEIAAEQIAKAVEDIAQAVRRLRSGRLNDRAITLLISNASKQPQYIVDAVLGGMESLERLFLKKEVK